MGTGRTEEDMTRRPKPWNTTPHNSKPARVRRRRSPVAPRPVQVRVRETSMDVDPIAARLVTRAESLFTRLGSNSVVLVEVTSDAGVLAQAHGISPFGALALGKITIGQDLLDVLSWDEMEFVLAHEVAHIHHNHLVARAPAAIIRSILESDARRDAGLSTALAVYDMLKVINAIHGVLPADAAMLRRNELEADATAIALTRNKAAAESSLRRLVGDDLDAPSHTWEVFNGRISRPALTMRERLAHLRSIPDWWW